jgi:hypothetical protein
MAIELQTNISLETTPSAPKHLVNVQYVEAFFSGKIKGPVRLASTVDFAGTYAGAPAFTLTAGGTGLVTIDGVATAPNDRVLLVGQTDARENGIYVVTNNGSAAPAVLTRADDFDDSSKISNGVSVTVDQGDLHANTTWRLTTPDPITLDTSPLTFVSTAPATGTAKFSDEIDGDGTATEFTITHGLGTEEVQVQVWNLASKAAVLTDITIVDDDEVEIGFAEAPPNTAHYKVVVIG